MAKSMGRVRQGSPDGGHIRCVVCPCMRRWEFGDWRLPDIIVWDGDAMKTINIMEVWNADLIKDWIRNERKQHWIENIEN